MRLFTPLAAALMALTTAAHVFGGGPEIMDPVAASALTAQVQSVLWVVWHGITTVLVVMTMALAYLSRHDVPALRITCFTICLAFAGLFVVAATGVPNGFAILPQWAIFTVLAVLVGLGRPSSSTSAAPA
ncbi:MAG: hypothetical protein CSA72_03515 [Rhodobacterales bacterium]|nr:MAG: hypothetical protein CSA72_03515 [Rhodobacterales bacterium]